MDPATLGLIGAGISGATSIVGGLLNANSQGNLNAANRAFDVGFYEQQNQTNIDNWNRQNAYNAPAAQMARYKAAGLNPNLIYGSGTASAGNASPVSSASAGQPSTAAPRPGDSFSGLGNLISTFQDVMLKVAQTNNVLANTANTYASKDLTETQTDYNTRTMTARALFPELQNSLTTTQTEQVEQNLSQSEQLFPNQLKSAVFKSIVDSLGPQVTQANLNNIAAQTADLWQRYKIDSAAAKMSDYGISPGDGEWYKIVAGITHTLLPNFRLFGN